MEFTDEELAILAEYGSWWWCNKNREWALCGDNPNALNSRCATAAVTHPCYFSPRMICIHAEIGHQSIMLQHPDARTTLETAAKLAKIAAELEEK